MPRPTCNESWLRSVSVTVCRAGCLVAVAAAVALWPAAARATGSGDEEEGASSFFDPAVIERPEEAPFFRTPHALYQQEDGDGASPFAVLEGINAKEWSAYFRGKVAAPDLSFLLYKMKLAELDKLIWAFEGKSPKLGKEATALKAQLDGVDKGQVLRALYYLGFAKRCEPITLRRLSDDAWDTPKFAEASANDYKTAEKLLASSQTQLASTTDKFLQERYRFQRLRLMFYTGRDAEAEQYYAANLAAFTTESSVKYRFMDVAAGAFYHDKKFGQANYLYSLVFDHFAPLKRTSYLSFRPVEDVDWKECLGLAKSEREKTVIWQLLGIYADGLAAIEKIYATAPASNLLPLLLVREVNKAEEDWSLNENSRRVSAPGVRSGDDVVGKKRLALVKKIAEGQKAVKPQLWQVALGHLYALSGDAKSALGYLELAEKSQPKDPSVERQARMSRLFVKVRGLKAIDKGLEPYLATELVWLTANFQTNTRAGELHRWTLEKLSRVYGQGGDTTRELLLLDNPASALYYDSRRIDSLVEFKTRAGKSAFDEFLASNHHYSPQQLNELKALNELYAGRLKSAVDLFAQAGPELGNQPLPADPFLIHIVDCHDCDFAAKQTEHYTKASFARKLLELSAQAEGKTAAAAQASFSLANGLYNMSYFGNARAVYRTEHGNFSDDAAPNRNMALAEKYYKRVLELPADRELKAKACFMAAKTEQNRYFNKHPEGPSDAPSRREPVHSPMYFRLLKESYANTRYYQEIIKECGYFRSYLKR